MLTVENMSTIYTKNYLIELCFKMDVLLCLLILIKLDFGQDELMKIVKHDRIKLNWDWKQN
jgi:hypothetical protein